MSTQSTNLDMTILEEGDPADLTTISDNFDAIDAVVGDIATVESSPTASSHAVGEFLLYEGRLYKATAAISAGDSLVLGTNVQAANIGSEIKSIRDSTEIHIETKTLTTNSYGNFETGLSIAKVIILYAKITSIYDLNLIPFVNAGNWFLYAVKNTAGTSPTFASSGVSKTVEICYINRA